MDGVRGWVSVICISSVVCTMLEFVTPNGKIEKTVRFVFNTFMLIAIIIPLTNLSKSVDIDFKKSFVSDLPKFSYKVDNQYISVAKNNIKHMVERELRQLNVKSKKIDVFMDKQDKDCISISKIKIYLGSENLAKKEEVKKKLEEKLSLDVEVF